ncbi:NAD(P)-dependent oxidoreductase [Kineococcus terrestris]|uniref:NAD(P)-dependent oxidoreductase n=1 Tax=Kineococcus terrestris TaxID=2044856 RepID=UPI0034DAFDE0
MRLVVLGARGGVGRRAVRAAVDRGHDVVAAARGPQAPPDPADPTDPVGALGARGRVVPVELDVRDAAAVRRALEGADAALWCVGVTPRSGGDVGRSALPHVLTALRELGVPRLVTVSGAGVAVPGERKGPGARLVSAAARRFGGDLVRDKEGEHALLAATGGELSWTEVRPPRLREADATGSWVLSERAPGLTARAVAKGDVAEALVHLATSREQDRRSPFLLARTGGPDGPRRQR